MNNSKTDANELIKRLGNALGVSPNQLVNALKNVVPQKEDHRNATCPKCSGKYRIFDKHYGTDQEVCPACKDEELSEMRAQAQKPERDVAKRRLQEIELAEREKKHAETSVLAEVVATAVAEALSKTNKKVTA